MGGTEQEQKVVRELQNMGGVNKNKKSSEEEEDGGWR